jgi:hypothetical protein
MVGFEDGTVQIVLYNSNFEIAYTADARNKVIMKKIDREETVTRKDQG